MNEKAGAVSAVAAACRQRKWSTTTSNTSLWSEERACSISHENSYKVVVSQRHTNTNLNPSAFIDKTHTNSPRSCSHNHNHKKDSINPIDHALLTSEITEGEKEQALEYDRMKAVSKENAQERQQLQSDTATQRNQKYIRLSTTAWTSTQILNTQVRATNRGRRRERQ